MKTYNKYKAAFECDCHMHIIECNKQSLYNKNDFIGFTIYEHRSRSTGELLKRPKEMGTVVLIKEEAKKFYEWVSK